MCGHNIHYFQNKAAKNAENTVILLNIHTQHTAQSKTGNRVSFLLCVATQIVRFNVQITYSHVVMQGYKFIFILCVAIVVINLSIKPQNNTGNRVMQLIASVS